MNHQRPASAAPTSSREGRTRPAPTGSPRRLWLKILSVLNALVVLTLFVLIVFVSERWWVSAALTFAPRLPYAVPSVVLLGLSFWLLPRWSIVNGLSTIVSLVFIAGMCAPVDRDRRPSDDSRVIKVLTCNVQNCESDANKLMGEFLRIDADVFILQEFGRCEPLVEFFEGWNVANEGEYRVFSRYPLRRMEELRSPSPFGNSRRTAILFEIDHPSGTFQVLNVHCHTARWGIRELKWHSIFTEYGVDAFDNFQHVREVEWNGLVDYCARAADRMPTIFAGDFNTPSSSNWFAPLRDSYRSAYESAGWGYGYTSPCNTQGRWPNNTPWLRIDHILLTQEWDLHSAAIGRTNGSDHRLMWAEVSLRE